MRFFNWFKKKPVVPTFRVYEALEFSTQPLIEGEVPYKSELNEGRASIVVSPDNHILTAKEWSQVIADNILYLGQMPAPKSKYKLSELRFFTEDVRAAK